MVREAQLDRLIHSKKEALEWLDRQLASMEAETTSGRPALNAVGMDHLDRRPRIARRELESQRDDLADQDVRVFQVGLADQDEHAVLEPVKFQEPRARGRPGATLATPTFA